ncbi:hypothetical protein [uncultured Reyranella sp.]|jgi:hypothetical protein|uniref:hypothetical protein n=1 Tax=uncultured Reyranella sp. TaxID=735512 RepID=UPI00259C69EE|nr:hypothetical protein [uncultured Reyranella sp.]
MAGPTLSRFLGLFRMRDASDPSRVAAVSSDGAVKVEGVTLRDSTGGAISPDRYPQTLTYNGDGTVNTVSFTDGTYTWTQTFTYTAGKVIGISAWVQS